MIINDFVKTPDIITETLLARELFSGTILEPCCGDGAISKILSKHNLIVTSSDKFDYGYGAQQDAFTITNHYDCIITNPPFTQQQALKKHLLSLTDKLALLWYVKNIGNEIETKTSKNLKTVYVFNKKIEWVETKLGWLFGWYVWEKDYAGDITIKRIDI